MNDFIDWKSDENEPNDSEFIWPNLLLVAFPMFYLHIWLPFQSSAQLTQWVMIGRNIWIMNFEWSKLQGYHLTLIGMSSFTLFWDLFGQFSYVFNFKLVDLLISVSLLARFAVQCSIVGNLLWMVECVSIDNIYWKYRFFYCTCLVPEKKKIILIFASMIL